ncbi:MAG TPA: FtsQ-type POTRA domain-containing protein [Lachnospiraceae bacterium]|nr:FtsQ-type POTRA domain-containing protein [Lachnospiraceae bacterium]
MANEYTPTGLSHMQKIFLIIIIVFLVIGFAFLYLKTNYTVTNVKVEGNEHYSDDEIKDMVIDGKYGNSTIYLFLKYRNKEIKDIPFIETMEVELKSADTINIHVYEKSVAGYVEFLGRYLYFDKDGIVVESSTEQMEGIPYVTGLHFDHVVLHEKLPVENEEIFRLILNITQLLTKYGISTDRIYFDSAYDITLYFEQVKIYLGNSNNIDEKINKLQYLLPELQGLSGTLHMENYSSDTETFTFQKD